MNPKRLRRRRWLLVLLTLTVFGVYVARLIDIQIVRSEEIRRQLETGSIRSQVVKATRGEIVDRNGVPLVSNRLGYDVVVDRAFFPKAEQNAIILRLIELFEKNGGQWIDNLPMQKTAPYAFLPGYETEVERLKSRVEVQPYTSSGDTMFHLAERYGLLPDESDENPVEYTPEQIRKIAGVRYEMERLDFSVDNPYTFATDIDIDLVLAIKEHSYALSGVDVQESAIRVYEQGDVAPHLIGRVGPMDPDEYQALKDKGYAMNDVVGKSGAELAFESVLRGQNGNREILLDASGRVVSADETDPPVLGNTLVLTIDSQLQRVAQQALPAQIKYLQNTAPPGEGKEANAGAVVAIHVPTGQLLACATYPTFDLGTYLQDYADLVADELNPLYNRALRGVYAPGSTFKPVVGTAGLANGVIADPDQTAVYCGMVYTRFQDYQPRCLRADGNINLIRALSLSCNIFFYDVGWNVGIDQVDKFARQYGLGEPTGIELYEERGRRSNPDYAKNAGLKWEDGDVLQSSIGQLYHGFTPLQLANYTATIANRGKRMKVTVVKEILDYNRENVIQPFAPQVADQVDATPAMVESVIRGMLTASRSGTAAHHFGSYPIDVASKTGTPEDVNFPNSTFICFAPVEDPQIAIAVVIENGWHGYTGAPVAKAIFDEFFKEELAAVGYRNPNPLVSQDAGDSSSGESVDPDAVAVAAATGAPVDPIRSEDESSVDAQSGSESDPQTATEGETSQKTEDGSG